MRLSRRRVRAIVSKELREYRHNGNIIYAMAILPLIFLVQPLVQVFAIPAQASGSLRHEHALLYMLAIPVLVPATLASYSVVGERLQAPARDCQRREPLSHPGHSFHRRGSEAMKLLLGLGARGHRADHVVTGDAVLQAGGIRRLIRVDHRVRLPDRFRLRVKLAAKQLFDGHRDEHLDRFDGEK